MNLKLLKKRALKNWDIMKCSNINSATYCLIFDKSKAPQHYAAFIMKFNILHCVVKMSKTNQIYNDSQIPVSLICLSRAFSHTLFHLINVYDLFFYYLKTKKPKKVNTTEKQDNGIFLNLI